MGVAATALTHRMVAQVRKEMVTRVMMDVVI